MSSPFQQRRKKADSLQSQGDRTDSANAQRFVEEHRDRLRFCPSFKRWLVWDGRRWKVQERGQVIELARQTADRVLQLAETTPGFTEAMQFARHSKNKRGLDAMVSVAESHSEITVDASDLDSDPFLLNCENGVLDLRTQELLPHDPERLMTKLCPATFDPDVDAPRWCKFVASILPREIVEFLQRWFGYCLTGVTREQLFLVFLGPGANGKSVMLEVIRAVMGDDFCVPVPNDLIIEKPSDAHPTSMIDLEGRRLVLISETSRGQRLNEARLKLLTGGDQLTGRGMRQDNRRFDATHKLVLATNFIPRLTGGDKAVWRRVTVVPFEKQFWDPDSGETGPASLRQDKELADRLKKEASGILSWMVVGCRDWQERGLALPKRVIDEKVKYRAESDPFMRFVHECCELGPEFSESASALFAAYKKATGTNLNPLGSERAFSQRLAKEGFERIRSNGTRYRGIRLKSDPKLNPNRRPKKKPARRKKFKRE